MKTNQVKTQILQILNEIIAYLHSKSLIKKKITLQKHFIFQQPVTMKVQNLEIFG